MKLFKKKKLKNSKITNQKIIVKSNGKMIVKSNGKNDSEIMKNEQNYKNLLANIAVSIVFTLKVNSGLEIIKSSSS